MDEDWKTQKYDNAEGTFATKEKTEEGRNKYVGVLAVLLIGSFVIPMVLPHLRLARHPHLTRHQPR